MLVDKAGSTYSNEFLVYRVSRVDYYFFDYKKRILDPIEDYLDDHYSKYKHVPSMVYADGTIDLSVDSEVLRNISSLHTIITIFPAIYTKYIDKINKNIEYYMNMHEQLDLQTLSFLLRLLRNRNVSVCNIIYNKLHNALLEREITDKMFALGEILIAVLEYKYDDRIVDMYIDYYDGNDEFSLNWYLQFVYYAMREVSGLEELVNKIVVSGDETNNLAVYFELLSTLIKINKGNVHEWVIDKRNETIKELYQNRRKNRLFAFKNNTARFDITCHVINGLDGNWNKVDYTWFGL